MLWMMVEVFLSDNRYRVRIVALINNNLCVYLLYLDFDDPATGVFSQISDCLVLPDGYCLLYACVPVLILPLDHNVAPKRQRITIEQTPDRQQLFSNELRSDFSSCLHLVALFTPLVLVLCHCPLTFLDWGLWYDSLGMTLNLSDPRLVMLWLPRMLLQEQAQCWNSQLFLGFVLKRWCSVFYLFGECEMTSTL